MADLRSHFMELGAMDQMSRLDTAVHRLDPRAKILTSFAFIVVAVSFGKYEFAALLPLLFFPVAMASVGRVPPGLLGRKLLFAIPFVLFVGLFNPFFDHQAVARLGGVTLTGGWVSFASILLRSALTLSVALLLVAVTGMPALCAAMERLGVPRAFAVQLLFLYRYLFVLAEEALRMARARELRTFTRRGLGGRRGMGMRAAASMLGHLLLRTLDRAERIYHAMRSRGFTGEVRLLRPMRAGWRDAAFVLGWCAFFAAARAWNLPRLLGALLTGGPG
jgi:cobalt/nickel transport system permease protein